MKTTRKLEHLDAPILRLVRGLCREAEYDARKRGRVSMAEICGQVHKELGVQLVSRGEAGPLKRLQDSGELAKFPVREGPADFQAPGPCYTYRVSDLDDLNLLVLLDLARRHMNPNMKLKSGRNSTSTGHASRQVYEVKDTQLEMIEKALKRLVDHLLPRFRRQPDDTREQAEGRLNKGLSSIGADMLVWAEGAGAHGLGDWAILKELDAACRGLADNTVDRYRGAIRTLLDLAATHGYLLRRDVHGGDRSFLPASWTEALKEWDRIVRESKHHHRGAGTAQLSRIMAAMAGHFSASLAEINPLELDEEQSSSFLRHFKAELDADARITMHHRSTTLSTLRALMDGGVLKQIEITEYDRRRIRGRKNAFESGAMKAIAFGFDCKTRKATADYSLFTALGNGAFFDPKNPYSLPRLIDWFTLTSARHRLRKGLSAVNSFPRERTRGSGGLSGRLWKEATILQHLELMGMYLGYLVRYHGFDLDGEVDASHLFTNDLLDGFVDAVEEDDWTTEKRAADFIYHASLYASPCWESAALGKKDKPQADAFQALSDYAAGRGSINGQGFNGLTLFESQCEEWGLTRNGKNHEAQRRRSQRVQDAYEKAMQEQYAYLGMLRLRNAAITRFCREIGVADLDQLRREIMEENRRLAVTDFTTLRDILIWSDGLAAPNRRKTVALLDMENRLEKLNGELLAWIPAEKLKVPRNGDYDLLLGQRGVVFDLGYRFDLWDAYREARLGFLDGRPSDVMYLSTSSRERLGGEPFRLAPNSVSGLYRNVLALGAKELGIDPEPILGLTGLASSHAHRHAVGHFFVSHNQHELARRMLHHKGLDILLQVYAGGGSAVSAESVMKGLDAKG